MEWNLFANEWRRVSLCFGVEVFLWSGVYVTEWNFCSSVKLMLWNGT